MFRLHPRVGKITGTGTAIDVSLGFRPSYVRVVNETQLTASEAFDGQADGHADTFKDSGVGTTDMLVKSSNGITFTSQGFQIGTDADLNTASDVIWYAAF